MSDDATSDHGTSGDGGPLATLHRVRADPRRRWVVTAVGAAVGLALATGHWLGFVVGGGLVALPQHSFPRGLAAGLGFGLVALLLFGLVLASNGALAEATAMGPVTAVTVAIPVLASLLGSLARGLE